MKKRRIKHVFGDSDTDEEDVNQLEALLARRLHKGKGKFKGKLPIYVIRVLSIQEMRCIPRN